MTFRENKQKKCMEFGSSIYSSNKELKLGKEIVSNLREYKPRNMESEKKDLIYVIKKNGVNFTFYHVKLGNSLTIFVNDGQDQRNMKVSSIEELPSAYSQIIRSLKSNQPLESITNTTRKNVTDSQNNRKRVSADKIWYFKLGMGTVMSKEPAVGVSLGFGMKKELDQFAVDFSFLNFTFDPDDSREDFDIEWVKIMGTYYFDAISNNTFSVSGGLSYGYTKHGIVSDVIFDENYEYEEEYYYNNNGLRLNIAGGYEMLRSSNIRFFIKPELVLPLYLTKAYDKEDMWAPILSLSLGIGF